MNAGGEHGARSLLFVPGHQPERFEKACRAGADAVILDLEDAVAAVDKPAARAAVARWLATRSATAGGPAVALRINAEHSGHFEADLALCGLPGITAVVPAKAERAASLQAIAAAAPQVALWPLIESAAGFAARDVLAAVPGVCRLLFGSIDFRLDLGIPGEGDALLHFRSQLVLSSRLAGLQAPVDGVSPRLDDEAALVADAARACRLGFGGKLCIHPRQVGAVNEAFLPGAVQIDWAVRVLAAVDAGVAGTGAAPGAFALHGEMIDRPVLLRAQAVRAAALRAGRWSARA